HRRHHALAGAEPDRRRARGLAASRGVPHLRLDRERSRRHAAPARPASRWALQQLPGCRASGRGRRRRMTTRRVAVVGAGTMGHGIAYVATLAGCSVALTDSRPEAIPPAIRRIGDLFTGGVKRGQLGKEPIVVKDTPGFASSRLGVALGLEAIRMLEQGVASAEDIDKAMELGYNHPMGPLKLTDLVGLDVRLAIAEYLYRTLEEPQFEPPQILKNKVAKGELGKKTGKGFYSWP